MNAGQACRPCRGSCSLIPGRGCFGDLPGTKSSYLRPPQSLNPSSPLRARLQCTSDLYTRVVLARDLALFTVAFETTKRGDELSRTLIQRILRIPNLSGFLFNFQWGKTMRDVADHLILFRSHTTTIVWQRAQSRP